METLYSLSARTPAGSTVFDLVADEEAAGWFRHRFDAQGSYVGVRPVTAADIRGELAGVAPATFVLELRAAAAALEIAAAGLREVADSAARAGEPEEAGALRARAASVDARRREALDEVASVCEAAGDDAAHRPGNARRAVRRLRRGA